MLIEIFNNYKSLPLFNIKGETLAVKTSTPSTCV